MPRHRNNSPLPLIHGISSIARDPARRNILIGYVILLLGGVYGTLHVVSSHIHDAYKRYESVAILDRHGEILTLYPNERGMYARYIDIVPEHTKKILIAKEDQYFYSHIGINLSSTLRALWRGIRGEPIQGASTITQQLVKNMLGHVENRSLSNKLVETLYAIGLTVTTSKEDVLTMYANTVFMGNQIAGLSGASELYFNQDLAMLDDTRTTMLLATLSSPSTQHPWNRARNEAAARHLAGRAGIALSDGATTTKEHPYQAPRSFELSQMGIACESTCTSTIDKQLTDTLRTVLQKQVERSEEARGTNGALVVLKVPENEVLAVIGTPDPSRTTNGYQYNMASIPRPIGSTIKPFIYARGFEKGLRPYSLVDDREYRFTVQSGFPLYPKNYDGKYRGIVTLQSALANSLNVPTVKVLEFVTLEDFYALLANKLQFKPLRDFDTYQYGIALGGLEMDPLTLAHLYTVFPNEGEYRPLTIIRDKVNTYRGEMTYVSEPIRVFEQKYSDLVTKILNDRMAGVEQFGLASNLHLSQSNVAVKTGTSRDYHDSWTVGYTPDFVVVSWLGNVENRPLKQITGASEAGSMWNSTMEVLFQTPYNTRAAFPLTEVVSMPIDETLAYGLRDDQSADHRTLLLSHDLITAPQTGDQFKFTKDIAIPLRSHESVYWYAGSTLIGMGPMISFRPKQAGHYVIRAEINPEESQTITINVVE